MDIWKKRNWQSYYKSGHPKGLRVFYESGVDSEVKRACKDFVLWLRESYDFPIRINMYVKSTDRIKSQKGDFVCGTFLRVEDPDGMPYAKIATGDYSRLCSKWGRDEALASILWTIAHELTHYFQWINRVDLTPVGEERQAINYADRIICEYSFTRDHP